MLNKKQAIKIFRADAPRVCDFYEELPLYSGKLPARTLIYDSSAPGEPDEPWDKECPDYEHDCLRCGCGRTVAPDWYVEGTLEVFHRGEWKIAARWVNNYRGGYGI
jgi:hypothetical protein